MRRSIAKLMMLAGLGALTAGAGDAEKVLVGFEVDEMKPKDAGGATFIVGRAWTNGQVKAGWRWKDHEAELKAPEGFDGDVTIYGCKSSSSRDMPGISLYRTGVTQGKHAKRWTPFECEARSWRSIEQAVKDKKFGYWPPEGVPTHTSDHPDYFFDRYGYVWRYEQGGGDWTAWDRLRVDVLAPDAPVILGLFIRDSCGPRIQCGPIGVRTAVAVFRVPKGEPVTLDFPLREMAAVAELDLARVWRYQCRINGYAGATAIYFDNIRLARKDAPLRLKAVAMDGEPRPFSRPVYYKPVDRVADALKRESGAVEKIGPVTIGAGNFGGSGTTYVQNTRRACVAYDDRRLLVVAERSAWASFDGGKTWGGLAPGQPGPARLKWGLRANMWADESGDVYLVGTPNCDSYNEGHDICAFRLTFTGREWVDGHFTHIGQNGYKCTAWASVVRLPTGRVWACWQDGWANGEGLAKYSDDDAFTWVPCRDAAAAPPRPFLAPKLEDLQRPAADRTKPPEQILLWPAARVAGPLLVPYKGSVAAVDVEGKSWQAHDGEKWGLLQKGPSLGSIISEAVVGEDHIFLARGGRYGFDGGKEVLDDLVVADLSGAEWKKQTLEPEKKVWDLILTSSGNAVFCFYVLKAAEDRYEVRCRRWKDGQWGDSTVVATETGRINHVAAPQKCPPNYAAVWWDTRPTTPKGKGEVRFALVPNR